MTKVCSTYRTFRRLTAYDDLQCIFILTFNDLLLGGKEVCYVKRLVIVQKMLSYGTFKVESIPSLSLLLVFLQTSFRELCWTSSTSRRSSPVIIETVHRIVHMSSWIMPVSKEPDNSTPTCCNESGGLMDFTHLPSQNPR